MYSSFLGNYYSDYAGIDADGDGIGDTTHDFVDPETQDDTPLIAPLSGYGFDAVFFSSFEGGDFSGWTTVVP